LYLEVLEDMFGFVFMIILFVSLDGFRRERPQQKLNMMEKDDGGERSAKTRKGVDLAHSLRTPVDRLRVEFSSHGRKTRLARCCLLAQSNTILLKATRETPGGGFEQFERSQGKSNIAPKRLLTGSK
jgi:hypothetical protein